jgi:hypothetical protein
MSTIIRRSTLALCVLAGAGLAGCSSSSPSFPTGTQHVVITWHPGQHPLPFDSTIAGVPVTGTAVTPPASASELHVATWKGQYGGKPFELMISADQSDLRQSDPTKFQFDVTGTYASQEVRGTVNEAGVDPGSVAFDATVDGHHVTGTVSPPTDGSRNKADATFTVH